MNARPPGDGWSQTNRECSAQPASRRPLGVGGCCIESRRERVQGARGAGPPQLIHVIEERDVGPKRGERSEQQRQIRESRTSITRNPGAPGIPQTRRRRFSFPFTAGSWPVTAVAYRCRGSMAVVRR